MRLKNRAESASLERGTVSKYLAAAGVEMWAKASPRQAAKSRKKTKVKTGGSPRQEQSDTAGGGGGIASQKVAKKRGGLKGQPGSKTGLGSVKNKSRNEKKKIEARPQS